jgi:hypothetical protein
VTDDDPLTPGEIRRSFTRLENEDRSLAERLTRIAGEMLPMKLWDSEHRALSAQLDRHEKAADADRARIERDVDETTRRLEADIAAVRRELEREAEDRRKDIKSVRAERNKRSELTWQKMIGLIAALAAIAGVIVTLLGQSKGLH